MTQQVSTTFHDKYEQYTKLLDKAGVVAFDTEASGLDQFDPEFFVMGFSFCFKVDGYFYYDYVPVNHTRGVNDKEELWRPFLEKIMTKTVIAHNVMYDHRNAEILTGKKFSGKYYDTARLSQLLDENWGTNAMGDVIKPRSLEELCNYYLGKGVHKTNSREMDFVIKYFGWGSLSYEEISEYGANDAYILFILFEELVKRIEKAGESGNVMEYWNAFDKPNYDALYAMKTRGVKVDLDACRLWEIKAQQKMVALKEELGFDPQKPTELKPVIYERLGLPIIYNKKKNKAGEVELRPTLDKGAMERYELMLEEREDIKEKELAGKILEYRGWSKALSSYYLAYQKHVSHDGRLRPEYVMHGTVTGRYACRNPNLQQIPKESDKAWNGEIKKLFIAEEGYELWEFDYSQLEFRLSAHFSREPKLMDVFNDDSRDIFNEMSADLEMTRQKSKGMTYSINYGAGAQRIMDIFGVTNARAKELIQNFYDNYPGLRDVNNHVKAIVEKNSKVKLWSGRYRHFRSGKEGYKGFNAFVQGGAADLVKLVMNRINTEHPEIRMLLQVHDSLIFEIPVGEEGIKQREQIVRIMEHPTEGFMDWRVHFKVDGHRMGEG